MLILATLYFGLFGRDVWMLILATLYFGLFGRDVWMLILAHSLFRFIWQRCVDGNTGTLSISVYLAELCGC